MKQRWKVVIVFLTVIAVVGLVGFFWPNSALRTLEQTRRDLRRQGFKIDLSEFDFSATADQRARAAAVTNAAAVVPTQSRSGSYAPNTVVSDDLNLMKVTGPETAMVVWNQAKPRIEQNPYLTSVRDQPASDPWAVMRELFDETRAAEASACQALLSGKLQFGLEASHGAAMLLPHLAGIKRLAQAFGLTAVLELHDGHKDVAWTNVLAATRLVTAWEPEGAEVSYLVRYSCVPLAYNTVWQALQSDGWSDERLAQLQHEWQSVDLLTRLPETEAFARASHADVCQRERRDPLEGGMIFRELLRSPRSAWYSFTSYWDRKRYRHSGTYEDERALLIYHRDRELQLRRAVQAPSWLQMRQLPGVTNAIPFQSKYSSRVSALLGSRQISLRMFRGNQGPLSRAAEAEARRQVLVTAIALQRYHGRHGAYPKTLEALVPEFLPQPPVDFMDGQPLRYRLNPDGHFVLYSVGLDCVDNGGKMRKLQSRDQDWQAMMDFGPPEGTDLVWPRPASAADVEAQRQEEEKEAARQRAALTERSMEEERQAEAQRLAKIEKLLAAAAADNAGAGPSPNEPALRGRPFSQLLRNTATAGTNLPPLRELLTPRQIFPGEDRGAAMFEVPVSYDVVTNVGFLHLVIDGGLDVASRGEEGERQSCERAANGNCLLSWTSTYDPPGKHAVQVEFIGAKADNLMSSAPKATGPAVALVSTNLCQFDSAYDNFDERGATLYAKLAESNGVYAIEVTSTNGACIRSFKGTTSNGVIKVHWDLKDDRGMRCTNSAFGSIFKITLPGSGRSQTLKGP